MAMGLRVWEEPHVHEPGGKLTGRQWQLTPRVNLYTPSVLPEAVALFDI
jgi:hypothetical protein